MALSSEQARRNGKKGGRPAGSSSALSRVTEYKARELAAKNEMPLDVMFDNMNFWRKSAESVTRRIEEFLDAVTAEGGFTPESLDEINKLLRKLVEFRDKAQGCAVDAAPYVHPRLTALAVKSVNDPKGKIKFSLLLGDRGQLKSLDLEVNGRKPNGRDLPAA